MGFGGVLQRESLRDAEGEFAVCDPAQNIARAPFEVFPGDGVVEQRGARQVERLGVEGERSDWRHDAAGLAVHDEVAANGKAGHRALVGRCADGVVGDLAARAVGDAHDGFVEIVLCVEDNVVCAGVSRKLRLFLRGDSRDDRRAAHLGHLDEQQADAARARVDKSRIVGAEGICGVGEIVRGHALEHRRRALLCRNAVRQDDEAVGGDDDALGVGLGRAGIGDDIADGRGGDAGADLNDGARALAAEDGWQCAGAVEAGAAVHIHIVDAGCGELDDGLAVTGGGVSDVRVGEDIGPAVLGDLDCFHGVVAPCGWVRILASHRWRRVGGVVRLFAERQGKTREIVDTNSL